jgi:hypothetical protein
MTVSTDGQICFGVLLGEGYELPWDNEDYDGWIESWWLDVQGYKPPFEIYDESGYIGGVKPPEEKIREYHDHRYAYKVAHPQPVKLVNCCSGKYPMYILAVPSSCKGANRGYPEAFNPADLTVTQEEVDTLMQFCADYGIEYEGKPQWWLSSYWG